MLNELPDYKNHKFFNDIINNIKEKQNIVFSKLLASSQALLFKDIFQNTNSNYFFVFSDYETAAFFYNDLSALIDKEKLIFLPSSYKRQINSSQIDSSAVLMRTDALTKLANFRKNYLTISYIEAVIENVVDEKTLRNNTLELKTGMNISLDFIVETLYEYNFERVDFVVEPGQFAVRGGLVDVFSFSAEYPIRIDFFGDEIDSIKIFDIESQLSKQKLNSFSIIPDLNTGIETENYISIFDFIKPNTYLISDNFKFFLDKTNKIFSKQKQDFEQELSDIDPDKQLLNNENLLKHLNDFGKIEINSKAYFADSECFEFNVSFQPAFNKNFDLLYENLLKYENEGYNLSITSENNKQIERLRNIFDEKGLKINFIFGETNLHSGFIDNDLLELVYTDHQIFDRYHKHKLKTKFTRKKSLSIAELNSLKKGDYVVHQDHGIGIFDGLQTINNAGKPQEVIKLIYKDGDELYVSIHSLHRISKYKSSEGSEPKIYKLGSNAWQKLKQKTKTKVKDIAKELIELYAKRMQQKAFAFSPDTYLQHELEASFFFEDTPDQEQATKAIKQDMESTKPMDRLVCGDVGFGKTEVAIRAAFKAVTDGKQVAVLVPTTILAFQHYNTFKDRLREFPVDIEYISRLRTAKEQTQIKKDLADGKIDIIIGTHKLVGKDIKFKDLGLLIIDEEQKFGVAVKEKLKKIKLNVDTLTLTATPIPRTMQFSLMGARDLSIINTPPPNRYPIQTEVHTFSEDIIRDAINYEIDRGGQVFFIHNRVQNIVEVERMINRICPDVKTVVAHGQMDGKRLEKIMLDFIDGKYGVLIATTIIESGLDIPNANTIIVNNAQNFGLSTLHQLRGRVGRTNKKAFAYFLAPPPVSLSTEARRRLKAIEEYSELGSGFNISLQDLDIRGAGNLLGGEQSGFIADIGFETYKQILNEAIKELKDNEFAKFVKQNEEIPEEYKNYKYVESCQVETDLELLFPQDYINNISERIKLYRRLDDISEDEDLLKFEEELIDRFGKLPPQTLELLELVRLRKLAADLGIEKIIIKNNKMLCYFVSDQESPYYQSDIFGNILNKIQITGKKTTMKQKNDRLYISVENIKSIVDAKKLLEKLK